MDPITIAVLAVLAIATTGAGAVAVRSRRAAARHTGMRNVVRSAIPLYADPPVSLFDVFWDLGASDFALELMASRQLLLHEPDDLQRIVPALAEAVAEDGGYADFVRVQLEAMEEYYRDHRGAGDRRAVLALAAPPQKALPAAGAAGEEALALHVPTDAERLGVHVDRGAWRTGTAAGPLSMGQGFIDVDQVVSTDVGRLLGSIFDGSIAREAKRWFAMREARQRRDELDRELEALYYVYAQHVRPNAASIAHLFDPARRWEADATRIAALRSAPPFSRQPWALCGTVLLEEAETMARSLAIHAAANVNGSLIRIDELARGGNTAMAGYLVYVNRYAFFVGRMALCHDNVNAVESALARLQTELGTLQRKGMV